MHPSPQPFARITFAHLCLSVIASGAVTVIVNPATATLRSGVTKTFAASVSGTPIKSVNWSVNGVPGGNTTVGAISTSGFYTTPAIVPPSNVIKVRATSVADPTAFAEATVTLQHPEPRITSVTPNMVNVGTFTIVIRGTGYVAGSKVNVSDRPVPTTFVSTTELRATATDTTPRDTTVSVSNPDPGASLSNKPFFRVMPPVSVNVSPDTYTMRIGTTKQYSVSVSNSVDRTVTWYVNNVKNGNATYGTITDTGLYTPPALLPPLAVGVRSGIAIKAVSVAAPDVSDSVTVSLQNAIPVITAVTPNSLEIGRSTQLTITGTGFAPGAVILLGSTEATINSLTPAGVLATGRPAAMVGNVATVAVRNPDPGAATSNAMVLPLRPSAQQITAQQAARFLQRASWGPKPDAVAKLQEIGIQSWLQEQYSAPVSDLPEPIAESTSITPAQRAFFGNAMNGPDQLRQRMGFALSQILVVSGVKTGSSHQLVPYMRMMNRNAFGNYFTLLKEVTLSPTMGRFLDMVNNRKLDPTRGIEPNENYARELLQLFTVGLVDLNMDGTPRAGGGSPYSEATVKEYAKGLSQNK